MPGWGIRRCPLSIVIQNTRQLTMQKTAIRLARLVEHVSLPDMSVSNPYRGFRYPPEVIQYAIRLYHGFSLSLREVELILAA
jgi:hypothetical protein